MTFHSRYTNMTKIMFLAFWYSSIFPAGMLLAAMALSVNYYTDRFSLMRSWQRAPRVGTEISNISLNYFFSTALFFLAVMSSFYWSAFPFDNLCPTDQTLNPDLYGVYVGDGCLLFLMMLNDHLTYSFLDVVCCGISECYD